MADFIQELRNCNIELLAQEAEDVSIWKGLKHTKRDLETFLGFNLAEIVFDTVDDHTVSLVCSSNTALIKVFQAKKLADKEKLVNLKTDIIHTKDKTSILTWDFIANQFKTIKMKNWTIKNCISINQKNVIVLDTLINQCLKR